jgi:hypothetical protein
MYTTEGGRKAHQRVKSIKFIEGKEKWKKDDPRMCKLCT